MIYLDSSVVLARLFVETRFPPDGFWRQPLTSSHLLVYEVWTRLNSRGLQDSRGEQARFFLGLVDYVELLPDRLKRALQPFPTPVRTLDALHLASILDLRDAGQPIELASYDRRLNNAARALGIPLAAL